MILSSEVSRVLVGISENTPSSVSKSQHFVQNVWAYFNSNSEVPQRMNKSVGGRRGNPSNPSPSGLTFRVPRAPPNNSPRLLVLMPEEMSEGVWGGFRVTFHLLGLGTIPIFLFGFLVRLMTGRVQGKRDLVHLAESSWEEFRVA